MSFAQWRANPNYSYGYVRAETLAGFINGLFLLFISFFIFSEVAINAKDEADIFLSNRLWSGLLSLLR